MKILLISHTPMMPVVGGDRIRIHQTLDFLLNRHSVDVVYISHDASATSMKSFEPRIGKEWRFYVPYRKRLLQVARTLFNKRPFIVNLFHHKPLQKLVDEISHTYDAIVCTSVGSAIYAFSADCPLKYLDMTDSLTMNYINAATQAKGIKKLLQTIDASRMKNFEFDCGAIFNRIAYISEKDRHFIGLNPQKTATIPNHVKINPYKEPLKDSRNIIFVGKMDYEPNILAVQFFAKEVMPKLPPDCKFIIVGMNPPAKINMLQSDSRITVTGYVDSVTPYYNEAAIAVAPMLSGSGVQNKIIEAMAHGVCTVTTPLGLEGLENVKDGIITSEPDPSVMAQTIIDLLNDKTKARNTGLVGYKLVQQAFGYSSVQELFYNDFV